jgi:glycosyltransferase involved in cell wall biosynthesis
MPRDIVFAAVVEWGRMPYWRWRCLFRAAVAAGHRVLWVDDFAIPLRGHPLEHPGDGTETIEEPDPGIFRLVSPHRAWAQVMSMDPDEIPRSVSAVQRAVGRLGFREPVVWVSGPSGRFLITEVGDRVALYDCADDLQMSGASESLLDEEAGALHQVDLAVAVSPGLRDSLQGAGAPVISVPNGVDPQHFARALHPGPRPASLAGIESPIVGYHGSIYRRMDWDLVDYACRSQRDWNFVFVGPVVNPPPVETAELPNLHLVGWAPYEDVPDYYRAFDVCWVPHRRSVLTAHQSSLKLYEYLAAGKPSVVTMTPQHEVLQSMVSTGHTNQVVIEALQLELATDSPERRLARVELASHQSWDARFATIAKALEMVMAG